MEFEQKIVGHGTPILTDKLLKIIEKGENSTCKIKYGNIIGSGFFCKINLSNSQYKNFLFTNNHILKKDFLDNNDNLVIIYKKQEKEIKLNNRKKFTDEELDFTIIEIKQEDNIKDFFEIDYYIQSGEKEYLKKDIGILQYPCGNELSFDKGEIISIKEFKLFHSVSTDYGSSGSPIFLIENLKIIGIHNRRAGKINSGIFMKDILSLLFSFYPVKDNDEEERKLIYNGEDIYKLCFLCPIDNCIEKNIFLYRHNICDSAQYFNKDFDIICPKCKRKENFFKSKFKCNYLNKLSYPKKNLQSIFYNINILCNIANTSEDFNESLLFIALKNKK